MRIALLLCALCLVPLTSWAGMPNRMLVLLNRMQSGQLEEVIYAGEQLMEMPSTAVPPWAREKATLLLAQAYEKAADFGRAATQYAAYADAFPRKSDAPSSQLMAAQLFAREGEFERAREAFDRFLSLGSQRTSESERSEAMLSLIRLEEERQNWANVVERAEKLLKAFPQTRNEILLGVLLQMQHASLRLEQPQDAARSAERILSTHLSEEEASATLARQARAEAMFLMLEPEYRAYVAFTFKSDRTLAADLIRKFEMKKLLTAKYLKVIEAGDGDMAIAALVRVASLTRELAEAIHSAPRPKGLDDIDCCVCYASDPPENQIGQASIELYDIALRKAFELSVYNEWTLEAVRALSELVPDRFSEPRELPLRLADARAFTP